MYKVEAVIRTFKLEDVQDALEAIPVSGFTIIEVKGEGKQKGVTHTYRGSQYTLALSPRLKLEVIVLDKDVEEVVQAIQASATTGEVGDGKIWVTKVEQVVRIRTGEKGDVALS